MALSVCSAFLLLYVPSAHYAIRDVDTNAADSAQYHFLALNLLQGRGYQSRPVGPIETYGDDARGFLRRPIQTALEDRFKVAVHRAPGYPLFLAAIYAIHGPHPSIVVRYQAFLAGLTGVLLVLIARLLWGHWAAVAGVLAALLLRHETEMAYAVSALLSECLAAFLLTLCLFATLWAKRGSAWRELVVGILMSATVLTRQALLLTAVFYGLFLLFPLRISWKRALAFAAPCAVTFIGWTLFLSIQSGGTVLMASTGSSSLLNGLDPAACAIANGRPAPAISEDALAEYWGGFPVEETPGLRRAVIERLPSRLREVFELFRIKLKIGFLWLPYSLIWCVIVGTVLASTVGIDDRTVVKAEHSRVVATAFCSAGALILALFILGYSHPAVVAACLLLLPAMLFLSAREFRSSRLWLSSWLLGYLAMTLATIGVRRYVRPYLPVLFLFAAAALPFFVLYVSGVLHATYSIARRTVSFRWRGESP